MIEVELKARIIEPFDILKGRIEETFKIMGSFVHKLDIYYKKDSFYFRLRRVGGKAFLTYKEKSLQGQTEVNREWETMVGSFEVAENFTRKLGLKPFYSKEKKGYAFQQGNLTLELLEVTGLGLFLELEILLSADASAQEVARAREKLIRTLKKIKISSEFIEIHSYQELLGY